ESAAHHEQGGQDTAGSTRAKRDGPDEPFHQKDAQNYLSGDAALQEAADRVVADAEGLRKNKAAETNNQTADGGPPHPVKFEFQKGVFGGIDRKREERGQSAGKYAEIGRASCRERV